MQELDLCEGVKLGCQRSRKERERAVPTHTENKISPFSPERKGGGNFLKNCYGEEREREDEFPLSGETVRRIRECVCVRSLLTAATIVW